MKISQSEDGMTAIQFTDQEYILVKAAVDYEYDHYSELEISFMHKTREEIEQIKSSLEHKKNIREEFLFFLPKDEMEILFNIILYAKNFLEEEVYNEDDNKIDMLINISDKISLVSEIKK